MGFYDTDYLEHHGVLGQKWGVRRFQNADGSLTPKGKARASQVENSKFRSKIQTMNAKSVYKKNSKSARIMAAAKAKGSVNLEEKSKKYASGTEKNKELLAKSKAEAAESKRLSILADQADKKLREINDGTLKAGRDFIVQRDLNVKLTNIGIAMDTMKNMNEPQLGKAYFQNLAGTTEATVIDTRSTKKSP